MRRIVLGTLLGCIAVTFAADRAGVATATESIAEGEPGAWWNRPDETTDGGPKEIAQAKGGADDEPPSIVPGILACLGVGALGTILLGVNWLRDRTPESNSMRQM